MAITVTANLTEISNCEATTGWSGTGMSAQDVFVRHGTFALGAKVSQTTSNLYKYDLGTGGTDMTGKLIYQWMNVGGKADTKANGGYRMYVEDTSGNYGYWYVGGSDTAAGWTNFVVDPASQPNTQSGIIDVTNIRYIGVQFKVTSKSVGNNPNSFWDTVRYGTGLQVTSLVSDTVTMEDIYQDNDTNAYGVIDKKSGAYFVQGEIILGDTGTGSVNVVEDGQIISFVDNLIQDGIYKIKALGNATGTTNVTMNGCYITRGGSKRYDIDMSGANLNTISFDGTIIKGAIQCLYQAGKTIKNGVFDDVNYIAPSTATFTGNTIKNCSMKYYDKGVVNVVASHNIADCVFLDNDYATRYETAGTYADNGNQYTGNTYDVINASNGSLTINASNGSNASTIFNDRPNNYYRDQDLVLNTHYTGNANDSSATANNGTVTSAVLTADKNAVSNQAYNFSASGSKIVHSDSGGGTAYDWQTISGFCYVKAPSTGVIRGLIAKYLTTGNQREFAVELGTGNAVYMTHSTDGTNFEVSSESVATLTASSWYGVAFAYDGNTKHMWINKAKALTEAVTNTGNLNNGTADVLIGNKASTGVEMTSDMDEVKLYKNYVFKQEDVDLLVDNYDQTLAAITGTGTINNTKTFSLTGLVDNTEVRIYKSSDDSELYGVENSSGGTVTYNYNYTGDTNIYVMIHNVAYEHIKLNATLTANGGSIPIQQQFDRWFSNP